MWHALNEVNEISTQELSRKLSLSIEDLALAIGWLAREKQYLYHEKEWFVVCQQWHQIQYVLLKETKKAIRHGQPISIVNLKSNTMKNTVQI